MTSTEATSASFLTAWPAAGTDRPSHVLPRFGPMRLDAITVLDVRE